MSSTMRTLMRSVMASVVRLLPAARLRKGAWSRDDHEAWRQDAPVRDQVRQDQARRLDRLRDDRVALLVDEVLRRAQRQGDVPVDLGELDDLGLLQGDGQDDDLLLPGESGTARIRGWGWGAGCRLGWRRQEGGHDLDPLEEDLDARRVVDRGLAVERLDVRVDEVVDREAVRADLGHDVDEVAGLDERAHARDLVDLDGDAGEARQALDVRRRGLAQERGRGDLLAAGDRLAGDLADRLARVAERPDLAVLRRDLLGRDHRGGHGHPERDVARGDDRIELGRRGRGLATTSGAPRLPPP